MASIARGWPIVRRFQRCAEAAIYRPPATVRRNPPPAALVFDQIAAELENRIALTTRKDTLHSHASLLD